jgi:hypothetical protein
MSEFNEHFTEQYTPRWGTKTVTKKIQEILEFAFKYFSIYTRQDVGNEALIEGFGQIGRSKSNPNKNALNRFMRELLLTKTRFEVINQKKAEYKFSWVKLLWVMEQNGMEIPVKLKDILKSEESQKQVVVETVIAYTFSGKEEKAAKDVIDLMDLQSNYTHLLTENTEYKIQNFTDRLEAKHQTKTKVARAKFWAGWYDYDVEACSYTLLYQKLSWLSQEMHRFTTIQSAFRDKHNFRNTLSSDLEIDVDTLKEILATLLFNPNLVEHDSTSIWKILVENDYNPRFFFRLARRSSTLLQLIAELKLMWPILMEDWVQGNKQDPREVFRTKDEIDTETGEVVKFGRYKSTKFRSRIYFELERKVLDVIRKFMSGKICHLMHDGFFTPQQVDLEKLRSLIKQETGFEVNISESIL